MIIFVNEMLSKPVKPKSMMEKFIQILSPFAPHISEELWQMLGHSDTLAYEPWPGYDDALAQDAMVEVPIQVNGKLRSKLMVPVDTDEETIRQKVLADEKIKQVLEGKQIRKFIVANKGRLVNLVIG
jgi:leucyl-tRNA synthetase